MELLRHKSTKIYSLDGHLFFIYWKNNESAPKLTFSDDFLSKADNKWLLFFYESEINYDLIDESKILKVFDLIATHNAAILWVDDFASDGDYFGDSRRLTLDRNIIAGTKIVFEQDQILDKYQFKLGKFLGASVSFVGDRNLLAKRNDAISFDFLINATKCIFSEFKIGLLDDTSHLKFTSDFNTEENALDLSIPYLSKERLANPELEPVITSNIFDRANIIGCTLDASYVPFSKSNNSKFYITPQNRAQSIRTNLLNEKGSNIETFDIVKIKFSLSKTVIDPQAQNLNRYILYPSDGTISTNAKRSILGFAGTEIESINESSSENILIQFQSSDEILVNEKDELLETLNASKTSVIAFLNAHEYSLDSEKSPLFKNNSPETEYAFIKKANITEPLALPIIPTLSFKDNPDLIKLEEVFKKVRLERVKASQTNQKLFEPIEPHITPQGFLKTNEGYDFIKNGSIARPSIGKKRLVDDSRFKFRLKDDHGDIDLSIRKDQVFFVLTPRLFKQYLQSYSHTIFDVTFAINKSSTAQFEVDLSSLFPKQGNLGNEYLHDNSIVIFKFHKEKFSTLLSDIKKWTNYGSVLRGNDDRELEDVLDTINSKELVKKINDQYFQKSILEDPNWNGVVILNIPVTEDGLPTIFDGLSASQHCRKKEYNPPPTPPPPADADKLKLETELNFSYVAFPVNKTEVAGSSVVIKSTSFYGLLDYNPFASDHDYRLISDHLKKDDSPYKFILSKLLVKFFNSSISEFESFAFLKIKNLFDDEVDFGEIVLSHHKDPKPGYPDDDGLEQEDGRTDKIKNLIRLKGRYQKTAEGVDEFRFASRLNGVIKLDTVIKEIDVTNIGFSSYGHNRFRFDIDATPKFNQIEIGDVFSFDGIDLQNIGLTFDLPDKFKLPSLNFDLSRLIVLPKINFDGKGFLKSFPIRFSHFQNFKLKQIKLPSGKFSLDLPDFEFSPISSKFPEFDIAFPDLNTPNLFAFIFDIDLGTLGNLEALKALKGQLLLGWSLKGGFALGFKFSGASQGLHVDFGAMKLDIEQLNLCDFEYIDPSDGKKYKSYYLRLVNARLTIFGVELPRKEDFDFNGIIYANPFNGKKSSKVAWFIAATDPESSDLILGFGQRVGLDVEMVDSVEAAIEKVKEIFKAKIGNCKDDAAAEVKKFYKEDRNLLIATERILPKDWGITFKAIFNDPSLYGAKFGIDDIGLFIEIMYKRISDNLGGYFGKLRLPDAIRSYDTGAAYFRLPDIELDAYTNGDVRVGVGFPNGDDWSGSGFLQLRTAPPFVGWFGFYIMRSRVASLTLFKGYISDAYSKDNLNIIQAGFAMRVGLGAYIDGGFFYIGASISVYGILEGAFAFKKGNSLSLLFPSHFAVLGRVGAIAEVVVYVDFFIIQASGSFRLQVEFGMLLVYLSEPGSIINMPDKPNQKKGIQPVKVYVEGSVTIELTVKIGCIKFHLYFKKTIRFEYAIGGDGNSNRLLFDSVSLLPAQLLKLQNKMVVIKKIKEVPMTYLPAFTKVMEDGKEKLLMVHSFFIPFFGKSSTADNIIFSEKNILKNSIIKPFFEDLIEQLTTLQFPNPNSYETLRAVLLNVEPFKVNITIPNFIPTFIHGINSETEKEITAILSKIFLFDADKGEIKPCDPTGECKPIHEAYYDYLRIIPAPITPKIQVVDTSNSSIYHNNPNPDGKYEFKIEVEYLVINNSPTPSVIKEIPKDDDTINHMNEYFDDYKTQFVKRTQREKSLLLEDGKDIRENVIVPEFFKLIALLTLDAFYNDDKINPRKKEGEKLNPIITRIDDCGRFYYKKENAAREETKPWDPNVALEYIVGQLNYFYNSGLRLPNAINDIKTFSLYDILGQSLSISPIPQNNRDYKKVKISIDNFDITDDVFGTNDAARAKNIEGEKGMWPYIDGFQNSDFLQKLKEDFDPAGFKFVRPFELLPVTLSVQRSKLKVGNPVKTKFFELPNKLSQHGTLTSFYSFRINYADSARQDKFGKDIVEFSTETGTGSNPEIIDAAPCLNIEVRVKRSSDRVIEIVNVFAKDLNASYILRNTLANPETRNLVKAIDFYHKPDESEGQQDLDLKEYKQATIFKTNLSPRTSPPMFSVGNRQRVIPLLKETERQFIAESAKDIPKFTNLLWEALTINNGGYFLVLDEDFPVSTKTEQTIIVSFEADNFGGTDISKIKIPHYFNCFKLNRKEAYKEIFDAVDDNNKSKYLYIDNVKNYKSWSDPGLLVKAYHPTIPAHNFSFQIKRDLKNASKNACHYLPLEFSVFKDREGPIIDREKVLPIMPTTPEENKELLFYNHITPLVTKNSDPAHPEDWGNKYCRYLAIGNEYRLNYSLRDTYGFRTSQDNDPIGSHSYKHFYSDKIIPIESWPLVGFSYWLSKQSKRDAIVFDVSFSYNVLDILDIAGIPRKKDNSYEYRPGQKVTDVINKEKIWEAAKSVLLSLNTIHAQLYDTNSVASLRFTEEHGGINIKEDLRIAVFALIEEIRKNINRDTGECQVPEDLKSIIFTLGFKQIAAIKEELDIFISIERPSNSLRLDSDSAATQYHYEVSELNDESVAWDFKATYLSRTKVNLKNIDNPEKSSVLDLNTDLRAKTNSNFAVGVSSRLSSNEQVLYIIDENKISQISVTKSDLEGNKFKDKCYYGIRPFSNRLWSGKYEFQKSVDPGSTELVSFSNVDLDKALRLVLAKLDELLLGNNLSSALTEALKDGYNSLIESKKIIVSKYLESKIDWVMDDPSLRLNEIRKPFLKKLQSALRYASEEENNVYTFGNNLFNDLKDIYLGSDELREEFRDLLLTSLNNFYTYDGVIKTSIEDIQILGSDHRLTLNFKNDDVLFPENKDYNFFSSKLGFKNKNDWYIFFDQKEYIDAKLKFSVAPIITHIEFGIEDIEGSDIEHSTWIQLLAPISLKDYRIEEWLKINREFPEKPVIATHNASQQWPERDVWDDEVAKWKYELEIKDKDGNNKSIYKDEDIIQVDLILQTDKERLSTISENTFEGFVAFWSSRIIQSKKDPSLFDLKSFAGDLSKQLNQGEFKGEKLEVEAKPSFKLIKRAGKWSILNPDTSPELKPYLKLYNDQESADRPAIKINGFDLFNASQHIFSISPEIKVYRNRLLNNSKFWYETERVTPPNPAVPHIQYFKPLKLTKTDTAFNDLVFKKIGTLPYKTTAKYLINTDTKFPSDGHNSLPTRPVLQREWDNSSIPKDTDSLFEDFDPLNGFPAFTLSVYNKILDNETDLPIFYAETIVKISQ